VRYAATEAWRASSGGPRKSLSGKTESLAIVAVGVEGEAQGLSVAFSAPSDDTPASAFGGGDSGSRSVTVSPRQRPDDVLAAPFTIADPGDAGMLDVGGFDTATPAMMADGVRG
jgi:hypothetical protein